MTAQEALRQCVEAMKEVDFIDVGADDRRWHKLNAAQQVAEEVLKRPERKPFAYFVQPSSFGPFIECEHSQVGSFAAYRAPVAAQQAVATQIATPVGVGEEGETTSDYSAMRLRLIAEKLGLGNAIPEKNTDLWGCAFSVLGMIRREVEKLVTQPAAAPSGDVEHAAPVSAAPATSKLYTGGQFIRYIIAPEGYTVCNIGNNTVRLEPITATKE